jgi:hypothetical protein
MQESTEEKLMSVSKNYPPLLMNENEWLLKKCEIEYDAFTNYALATA